MVPVKEQGAEVEEMPFSLAGEKPEDFPDQSSHASHSKLRFILQNNG